MVKNHTLLTHWVVLSALFLGIGSAVVAQMPSDVLVLVNTASPVSVEIANHYMVGRGIPERNRVEISLPRYVLHPERPMLFEEFETKIWQAVLEHVDKHDGLHMQALLLSTDFPVRIDKRQSRSPMGASMILRKPWPAMPGKRPPGSNPYFVKDYSRTKSDFEWPAPHGGAQVFLPRDGFGCTWDSGQYP